MSFRGLKSACVGGIIAASLVMMGSSPNQMLEQEKREHFAQRWWPAHVTIHVPKRPGPHEAPLASVETYRGFVLQRGQGSIILAPTSLVRGEERVEVVLFDGRTAWARVPSLGAEEEPPLVALAWETGAAPAGVQALAWSVRPELGPGRRAWTLEPPIGATPGTGRPVLVNTSLRSAAPSPLERYWQVGLRSSLGAPLLDARGAVLCVVFRRWLAEPDTTLCVTESDATRSIGP